MLDKFREECGVVAIYGHPEAANLAYLGLYALQHRGQESAGIASSDGRNIHCHKSMGHVADIFTPEVLGRLPGELAIGHTRYSTAGDTVLLNAQPFSVACNKGRIAVAHNGNITNALELRRELEREGSIFQASSDTEVILHLVARSRERATRCRITSVSLEAWKMEPSRSSSRRSSKALVMFPLWATAMRPLLQATENGCALSRTVSPAVE